MSHSANDFPQGQNQSKTMASILVPKARELSDSELGRALSCLKKELDDLRDVSCSLDVLAKDIQRLVFEYEETGEMSTYAVNGLVTGIRTLSSKVFVDSTKHLENFNIAK